MGTQTTIASLAEQSRAAVQCALWYDNQRQSLLRTAPWGFARRQQVLTLLGSYVDATSPYPFLYKYAYPSDCLKFRYILAPPSNVAPTGPQVSVGQPGPVCWAPSRANRYLVMVEVDPDTNISTKVIVSNVALAIGVYTADVVDTDLFDPMFESALAASLAYKLVIPLSGNVGMREQFRLSSEGSITNARVADGNEAIPTTDHVVDWMSARGVSGYAGMPGCGADWGSWNCSWDTMNWGM